jgi:peptidoglycan hydrolase CwlO-like protein
MKKIILLIQILAFTTFIGTNQSFAKINLDQVVGAIESAQSDDKNPGKKSGSPLDSITGKLEEKVNKIVERIEGRLEKYEKKFDSYDAKLTKAEKVVDDITNRLNSAQIDKYLTMAKYTAMALGGIFILSFMLLIVIFMQLMKVNCALKKLGKK